MGSRLKRAQPFTRAANVTVMVCVAISPSPDAVTTTLDEPLPAPGSAVSLSATLVVLVLEDGVSGFVDHAAVTPPGKPLTEKLTLPVNDPPVTAEKPIMAEPPSGIAADCAVAVNARVGAADAELVFHPFTSSAPSTDPSPVARL